MTTMAVYLCPICESRSPTLSLWLSHLRLVHHSESRVELSCPADSCNAVYSKVNSLCSHMYRTHRDMVSSSLVRHNPAMQEQTSASVSLDLSLPGSVSHAVDQLLHTDAYKQMKKSSLFLIQLKEERLLTQTAVNDVVAGCREIFHHTVCRLQAGVNQKLAQSGIDFGDINGLDGIFDHACDPFSGLETAYLQEKFIEKELGYIVSMHAW